MYCNKSDMKVVLLSLSLSILVYSIHPFSGDGV